MKDDKNYLNPEVLEQEIFDALQVRTDIAALCVNIEKNFMPQLRETIKNQFMKRKKILLVFRCDFGTQKIGAELYAQEEMVDEMINSICEATSISKEDMLTSMRIWSMEPDPAKKILPSFMFFFADDKENAVASSARWGLEKDVFSTKN